MSGPHGGEQARFFAEDQRRINRAYRERCPRCRAEPGAMCVDLDGRIRYQLHAERVAVVADEVDSG